MSEAIQEAAPGNRWNFGIRQYALVVSIYLLATAFTDADFMGDTIDYVTSIIAIDEGRDYYFWEFAHVLWRPFGWLFSFFVTPLTRLIVGDNRYANVTLQLLIVSWLLGLLMVFLCYSLMKRLTGRTWIANVVTIAMIFSLGFLVHAQSGTAYVPGLSLLFLGVFILLRYGNESKRPALTAVTAGAALAISICFWVTYVLALPAALVAPLFVFGINKQRLRLVLLTAVACTAITGLAYALVLAHLGIYTVSGVRSWVAFSADAAFIPRGGIPRTVFSFARSFINMGNEGTIFKRFLSQDPFNPVSFSELFKLSLWKIGLFYIFFAAVTINLLRSKKGRQVLGLLIVSMIPVMGLALFLEGGAVDRYMPVFPFIFLALAFSLSSEKSLRALNILALVFFAAATITNVSMLAKPVLNQQQEMAAARVRDLQTRLKPESLVLTANLRDEVVNFNRSFPMHPINLDRERQLLVGSVIAPGAGNVSRWRQDFAAATLKAWKNGGDVWISRRVLSQRPLPEWGWVESDDPRVSWTDVYTFFSQLDMGETLGGEDGFSLIPPSPKNEKILTEWAQRETVSK
ncbi:MAG TPA: hypothetical protein VJM50_01175 [Pyrinomonadaceae bacterium]|nr:hypothetical protein [Pyrinomonadaceae bacterium]